ncbi:MAG: hypothetical protein RLY70_4254 [Planctomycetota bacterium]|jgi:cytochrome c553
MRRPLLPLAAVGIALFAACAANPGTVNSSEANSSEAANSNAVAPILHAKCVRCHGGTMPKGGLDLRRIGAPEEPGKQAELLQRVLEAIDANDMPPEGEPRLTDDERGKLLRDLRDAMRKAAAASPRPPTLLHRLTRFQYNNAVRDLFQLDRDVFELSEKLMTRRDRYLPSSTGKMPDRVDVVPNAFPPRPSLEGVKPFPKDLRAEHGFDNQANKLTLSPLLLDAFLRLSVSIVESPDFNPRTVGVWKELFAEPAVNGETRPEIERRLKRFLRLAFRGPIDNDTLRRYVDFTQAKIQQGATFTDSMKKAVAAALCSPMFLYRSAAAGDAERQFETASRLSFFLWSSIPDLELLDLAERGELARPDQLRLAVDRMLRDPKIERFLDVFPTQWLQLENALAVSPDARKSRYFNVDPNYPASLPMVLEPLLLFDAVFVENRPVIELVAPMFSYRNDFLRDWYESELALPTVQETEVAARNREISRRQRELQARIADARAGIEAIVGPAREKLLAERRRDAPANALVDLKPIGVWEFNGDLTDSLKSLDLTAHGDIQFVDGKVVLDRAYLQSVPLKADLKAKTLEVWCELADFKQRGGGLMTIEGPAGLFDSIVLGERQPRHWISGSNFFARTEDFPESTPETKPGDPLHLMMVYEADGTTRLYRNGLPYGKPFKKGSATFPKEKSRVLFGLRHLPAGGNKFLAVAIDKARLYDRALTAPEVAAAASGFSVDIGEPEIAGRLPESEAAKLTAARQQLSQATAELEKTPQPIDLKTLRQQLERDFEAQLRTKLRSSTFQRTTLTDPRYGGAITNAAVLSMTSGPLRTQPIARGSWITEVIFNDPPPPPPNNIPPLKDDSDAHLTIREQFAAHRANPSCAGCHAKIDPLGFALENFDITGRWRDKYENGRPIDATGVLFRKHAFTGAADFKGAIVAEKHRFHRAFAAHLLRFALARELQPDDSFAIESILRQAGSDEPRLQTLIREIAVRQGE